MRNLIPLPPQLIHYMGGKKVKMILIFLQLKDKLEGSAVMKETLMNIKRKISN